MPWKIITHLLHQTSGFGVMPLSQNFKEGSNTRVQYSRERSTYRLTRKLKRQDMESKTYHFTRNIQYSAHASDVFPIFLPLTSMVWTRLVASVPIAHKHSRKVVILLIGKDHWRRLATTWLIFLTLSASNFAVTEESTPPDIATTTGAKLNNAKLSILRAEIFTYPCRFLSGGVSWSHNKTWSVIFAPAGGDIAET